MRSNNITLRSKQAFAWDLGVFFDYIGNTPIEQVTHIDVDGFFEYCAGTRHNGDEALSRKYNTLNKFFQTMIDKEYLTMRNPLAKVEKIKVRKKVRGHVTLTEYKQIIEYLNSAKGYRGLALFSLLYSSGIRVSEVYQLNRDSLNFVTNEFTVTGKGDKGRLCIFSAEAGGYVMQYLNTRTDNNISLFMSRESKRWSIGGIQNYVKQAAIRAGVSKHVHPHLLRHGTAMLLLENGLTLDKIQKVLGHENIGTTQIYAQTSMQHVKHDVAQVYSQCL